jgi:hypothetical protein
MEYLGFPPLRIHIFFVDSDCLYQQLENRLLLGGKNLIENFIIWLSFRQNNFFIMCIEL